MADQSGAKVRFLEDVRVLELANLAPTQLGMHLADFGADIIKIEPPRRGDATRLINIQPGFNDSALHRRWNRGKRSIALDITAPAGRAIFQDLVRKADVIIEGLRPGTLAKMGFSWADVIALKPNIVMVALSGYGQTGPYRDLPSHGYGFDALAGLSPARKDEDGRVGMDPRPMNVGTILAPSIAATATLAALSWSRRTGEPTFLDVAQADVSAFANRAVEDIVSDRRRADTGLSSGAGGSGGDPAMVQYYRTRDDKLLMLMALERKFFVRLAEVLQRPDLLRHFPEDRYSDRFLGNDELRSELIDAIASRDLVDWMQILADADVPAIPVNENAQVADDPQLKSRIEWLDGDQSTVTMKTPVHSQPTLAPPRAAPAIGQDTVEILSSLGVGEEALVALEHEGVIQIAREDSDQNSGTGRG